jgi:UDPglucose--hexose-1-phosphate uridylyltransferase
MLRQDPLTGRWIIIATGRSGRPNEFPLLQRRTAGDVRCPFCPGHEADTTAEVVARGRRPGAPANSPGWRLRAFPNLYPAVTAAAAGRADDPSAVSGDAAGLFAGCEGHGRHEVVVYAPDHESGLATIAPVAVRELLAVVRDRVEDFRAEPHVRFIAPFCNHGPEAGATLAHPHLQIIGAPRVPQLTVEKLARLRRWSAARGSCLLCDLVVAERAAGLRLVADGHHWTALAPWASRFPWEVLLVPARHVPCALAADDEALDELAGLLGSVLRALRRQHGDFSHNIVFHLAPSAGGGGGYADPDLDALQPAPERLWHAHIEILPRLSRLAGFEAGTGYAINATPPEEAAARLRQLLAEAGGTA